MTRKKRIAIRTDDESYLVSSPATARTWMTGGDLYAEEPQLRNNVSRCVVVIIALILLCGGLAIIVLAAVQSNKRILPLCPNCHQLIMIAFFIGGTLAFVGAIGMASAVTRLKPLAITFTTLLVLLTLAFITVGVLVAVYTDGLSQSQVKGLWTDALHDDPSIICDLQTDMACSGFDHCCIDWSPTATAAPHRIVRNAVLDAFIDANTTVAPAPTIPYPFPNQCNITLDDFVSQCSTSCRSTNGVYQTPCNVQAEANAKRNFKVIMIVVFGFAVVLAVTAVASIRMILRS